MKAAGSGERRAQEARKRGQEARKRAQEAKKRAQEARSADPAVGKASGNELWERVA